MALLPLTLVEPPDAVATDPCATCGACCRGYYVPLSGFDLWRLRRATGLDPSDFVVAFEQEASAEIAFRLRKGGDSYELALEKQGSFAIGQPCVFLEELPGGVTRCGVYADRPGVCRAYPMKPDPTGAMALRPRALCPPGSWADDEADHPRWREVWTGVADDMERYAEIVRAWNAQIDAHPDLVLSLRQYINHVLTVYDRLAAM
jgi:Fe-S-cluster containining protein